MTIPTWAELHARCPELRPDLVVTNHLEWMFPDRAPVKLTAALCRDRAVEWLAKRSNSVRLMYTDNYGWHCVHDVDGWPSDPETAPIGTRDSAPWGWETPDEALRAAVDAELKSQGK